MKTKLLKHFSLRATMLVALVCAAFTGAWADTYNMTIDSSTSGNNNVHWTTSGNTTLTWNNITWAASYVDPSSANITTSKSYVQIGSKNNPATKVTISSTGFSGKKILKASLTGFCMSNTGPALTITAGSTTMLNSIDLVKTTSTTYETTNNNITLGENEELTFTINSSANAAICISAIEVEYEEPAAPDPSTVLAPTFSLASGAVTAGTTVTLTQDEASVIMYTTDGSNPDFENNNGEVYSEPITITRPVTIKAIAIDNDYNVSSVASASYTIDVSAPTFSVEAGKVEAGTSLTLSATGENTILYTTDGTTPSWENSNGELYSEPIIITSPVTIKAIAIDDDENVSSVASASYTINVAAPTFSVEAGEIEEGTEVEISASGAAMILYTTDGTDPTADSSNGTVYEGAIAIDKATTLKAIAIDNYGNGSSVVTAIYTIKIAGGIEITPNYEFWGKDGQFSGSTYPSLSGTQDDVTLSWNGGSGSTYANQNAMRFYKDNTLTIEAPEGKVITNVILTMSSAKADLTSDPTGYDNDNKTWTGSANEVTLSRPSNASSYAQITKITVVLADAPEAVVKTPVIALAAGTYEEVQTTTISCETDGATIYYTTDGSEPTAESTEYTSAITIDESMTIKAIAINGEDKSAVASATYTINLPFTTIAEVKKLNSGDNFKLNISGAQIVYFDGGKNMYVRDASGAILFYNSSSFSTSLKTGDILSGTVTGTYKPYNGLPEVTNSDISGLTATGNETVIAKTIDGTTAAIEANLCDLVKIEATEISKSSSKYYIGKNQDIQLYNGLHVENLTFTDGATADISGIATVYNTTYELFPRFESDIVYLDNSVAVSITDASGYATFCSDKALDFTGADAFEVYIATTNDDASRVTLKQIQKVPANTGVLLHSAAGGAVEETNIPVLDGDADDVEGNLFVPATTEIASLASEADGKKNFILSKVDGVVGFFKANGKKVAAGKAYIQVSADSPVKEFSLDGMTAVNDVKAAQSNSAWFNLAGQRVAQPTKGLYIVGGKKVIVK